MTYRISAMAVCFTLLLSAPASAEWNPSAWTGEEVVEVTTVDPNDGAYEFKVWLVVLDGHVYLRLGSRAAKRFEENTQSPYIGVRIAGHEFPRVQAQPSAEMAQRVDKAMADKYWSDVFIRYFSHPLTVRLVTPE